jgi:hypothetical protein
VRLSRIHHADHSDIVDRAHDLRLVIIPMPLHRVSPVDALRAGLPFEILVLKEVKPKAAAFRAAIDCDLFVVDSTHASLALRAVHSTSFRIM